MAEMSSGDAPGTATPTPGTGTPTASKPTLYVCQGDDKGAPFHPCGRVQKALRGAGIEYDKVIAAHGSPLPFLRKGSREELRAATGDDKLPALKLPDGTVLKHSRAIISWVKQQQR
jgi:glutathione S-transferase-like protein